jgi:hypothetical protein
MKSAHRTSLEIEYSPGIFFIGTYPIEILGVARLAMLDERVTANDEVSNFLFVEDSQQISEVLIHSSLLLLVRAPQLPYPMPRQT